MRMHVTCLERYDLRREPVAVGLARGDPRLQRAELVGQRLRRHVLRLERRLTLLNVPLRVEQLRAEPRRLAPRDLQLGPALSVGARLEALRRA